MGTHGGEVGSNAIDELRLIIGALTGPEREREGAWRHVRPLRGKKQNQNTTGAPRRSWDQAKNKTETATGHLGFFFLVLCLAPGSDYGDGRRGAGPGRKQKVEAHQAAAVAPGLGWLGYQYSGFTVACQCCSGAHLLTAPCPAVVARCRLQAASCRVFSRHREASLRDPFGIIHLTSDICSWGL